MVFSGALKNIKGVVQDQVHVQMHQQNLTMAMTADARTYSGTVSGMIRNGTGQAVAGCFVGLYQVVTDLSGKKELLVATTKTNEAGKYLFGGVVEGEYVVKAKLDR